jgi:hypothetical protein
MTQAYYTEEEDGEDENESFTSSALPTRFMHGSEPSSDSVQLDTDLPPGWQAYYNGKQEVVYFNKVTNNWEYSHEDLFKKPKYSKLLTTVEPSHCRMIPPAHIVTGRVATGRIATDAHIATTRVAPSTCLKTAPPLCKSSPLRKSPVFSSPHPDATASCNILPYVTPTKSDRVPTPKETVDLMSSDEETCLGLEQQTDLANVSSGMLPSTAEFQKSRSMISTSDDGTSNVGSCNESDKAECLF